MLSARERFRASLGLDSARLTRERGGIAMAAGDGELDIAQTWLLGSLDETRCTSRASANADLVIFSKPTPELTRRGA